MMHAEFVSNRVQPATRLYRFLLQQSGDIVLNRLGQGVFQVNELHADVEFILRKALRMNDPGASPDRQDRGVTTGRQVKSNIHLHIQDLSRCPLVFRENAVDDLHPAFELHTADGEIEYPHRL